MRRHWPIPHSNIPRPSEEVVRLRTKSLLKHPNLVLLLALVVLVGLGSLPARLPSGALPPKRLASRPLPVVKQWRGSHNSITDLAWDDSASSMVCAGALYLFGAAPKDAFGSLETTVLDTLRVATIEDCCARCAATPGCLAFLFQGESCQLAAIESKPAAAPRVQAAANELVLPGREEGREHDLGEQPLPPAPLESDAALEPDEPEQPLAGDEVGLDASDSKPQSAGDAAASTDDDEDENDAGLVAALTEEENEVVPVLEKPEEEDALADELLLEEKEGAGLPGADAVPASLDLRDAEEQPSALDPIAADLLPLPGASPDPLDSLDLSSLALGLEQDDEQDVGADTKVNNAKDLLSLVDSVAEDLAQDSASSAQDNAQVLRDEDAALRRVELEEEEDKDPLGALLSDETGSLDALPPPSPEEQQGEDNENDAALADAPAEDDLFLRAPAEEEEADLPAAETAKPKSLVDLVMSGEAMPEEHHKPLAIDDLLAEEQHASAGASGNDNADLMLVADVQRLDKSASSSSVAGGGGGGGFAAGAAVGQSGKAAAEPHVLLDTPQKQTSASTLAPLRTAPLLMAGASGETPQSQAECGKLAATPIASILPPGAYSIAIVDPFYKLKQKFFGRFRAVSEVHTFISEWQALNAKPIKGRNWQVDAFTLGRSAEERPIRAFEFGNARRGRHVFIVAGLRGCDWIAPLAAVHAAVAMLGRKKPTQSLLDAVRFHVVPLVNVDGYHYSRRKSPSAARHWCDNRRISAGGHGTNLERNWGAEGTSWGFGKKGKDSRKDKLGFQGVTPFSEPEVKAVRDYIAHYATGGGRVAVLHVRCCSGQVSPPMPVQAKAAGASVAENAARLVTALRNSGEGSDYVVVQRPEAFGAENTGQFVDWAYGAGSEFAYVLELKATNVATHMDRYQITPEPFNALCKELEVGLVAVAQMLLGTELAGSPPSPLDFKPKLAAAASSSSAKASSTSSASKSSAQKTSAKSSSLSSKAKSK
jgi:hypothetical protein